MKIAGYELFHFKALASTQTYARQIAGNFDDECAIVSDVQTRGFGRNGNSWSSESMQNLYATLLLRRKASLEALPQLSLVAAAALHSVLVSIDSKIVEILRIKWPNDLLCEGAKLAGILVQVISGANQDPIIIAGLGVNIANSPSLRDRPTTNLAKCGVFIDKMDVLERFIIEFDAKFALWSAGGFDEIALYINNYLYKEDNLYNQGEARVLANAYLVDNTGSLIVKTKQGASIKINHA